jgi:hypothetical protein
MLVCGKGLGRWWVLDEIYEPGIQVATGADCWIARARRLQARWGVSQIYADPSEPAYISALRDSGFEVAAAINDVRPGIQTVAGYLHPDETTCEPRLVIMREGAPKLVKEIQYYHWDERKEQPVKIDDHTCDALRYLIHTHEVVGGF